MQKSSVNLSSSWNRIFSDFEASAEWSESISYRRKTDYRAPRLLELKMASKSDFGAKQGGFGGHVGLRVGKFCPSMATRWHLKLIKNDIYTTNFSVGLRGGQNFSISAPRYGEGKIIVFGAPVAPILQIIDIKETSKQYIYIYIYIYIYRSAPKNSFL